MPDQFTSNLTFFNQMPFGVCTVNQQFQVQIWNSTLERWTGNAHSKMHQENLFLVYPHLCDKRYRKRIEAVLHGGPPAIFSSQLHPDFFPAVNSLRLQQTTVTRVQTSAQEAHLMFCVADMTSHVRQLDEISALRKQAIQEANRVTLLSEALEMSEKRFRAQYKNMPIPTYTWERRDDDFILVDYNQAANAITHGALAEVLGMPLSKYAQNIPEMIQGITRCYSEQKSFREELAHQLKEVDVSRNFAIHYAYVPPQFVMVHMEDITDHKIAEQERMEIERMQVLLETVGGVCHNVNQPLTVLSGYSEIIQSLSKENPDILKIAQKMHCAVESITEITKKLQNISRYERIEYVEGYILDIDKASD
jgi:PAS domain-containing protein